MDIELIPSGGGRFEVALDGVPIYQKSRMKRHAQPGEILGLIQEELQQRGTERRADS